ncbi:ABC transporter substrate-binding protein [Streptosporangium sp. NPDC006930]|uniref:ABC transporter substrate-binding protein n=1 Tax=unclassified Streptosporangium TaxID=2632669 RepID=UPI003435BC14
MFKRKRVSAILTAGLLAVVTLAACGGSDDEVATGAANAAGETKVRLLLAADTTGFADAITAKSAGYFEKNGLNVEFLPYIANSGTQVQAAVTGDTDIVGGAISALFFGTASDRDVVAVARASNTQNGVLLANSDFVKAQEAKGVTQASSVEERIKALEGAKFGVASRGPGSEASLRALLLHYKVPFGENSFVALGSPAGLDSGLKAKRVDAIYTGLPGGLNPVKNDYGAIWLGPADYAQTGAWDAGNIAYMAAGPWAEQNRETVKKFLASLDEARQLLADDPSKAAETYLTFSPKNDAALVKESFEMIKANYEGDAKMTENYFAKNKAIYDISSDKPSALTFADGVWTE